ncbi:LysR family transcriptional regulator [Pseudodonghicola flavimaris]|uniref:LysR family transcriptional regulator n=1 Tax=Pseudodonghicola flavimaris TaxID=3050036 RepID=A0ABT7F2P3_9RHOB|nr:LysR family transcriptional regulator [Pseudodonghicola flavimaris]MDK3018878.1 LysR family transcriptional regulator [Pseudodonghicola flavimaris]
MIRVRQLEVLCAVIDLGTTSGAAEALSVSQPAVSNMIRHIEDLVGFPLFKREKGRLTPTPEALHIAQEAQHLFSQQKRVDRIIDQLRGGTVGQLNVIATPSIGYALLPRMIAEFTRSRPRVQLSLEVGSVDEIIQHLISGRADLGFSITSPRHSALSVRPMAAGDMVCACPPDHELAHARSINLLDLNHVRHISYGSGTPLGQMIDEVYSRHGTERRYFCEVRHTSTALEMVAAGAGVALVDSFALMGRARQDVSVRAIQPALSVTLHGVTSNLYPTSHVALQFQEFMREALSDPELPHRVEIT